jgi:hypothetical protein
MAWETMGTQAGRAKHMSNTAHDAVLMISRKAEGVTSLLRLPIHLG